MAVKFFPAILKGAKCLPKRGQSFTVFGNQENMMSFFRSFLKLHRSNYIPSFSTNFVDRFSVQISFLHIYSLRKNERKLLQSTYFDLFYLAQFFLRVLLFLSFNCSPNQIFIGPILHRPNCSSNKLIIDQNIHYLKF